MRKGKAYIRKLKERIQFYLTEIPDTATTDIEMIYGMAIAAYRGNRKGGDR